MNEHDRQLLADYREAYHVTTGGKVVDIGETPNRPGWFRIHFPASSAVQHMDLSRRELSRMNDNLQRRRLRSERTS
jgi:hypothetical protein